jgi:hypothetical protein
MKIFPSPDRALLAEVWTSSAGESRVQIKNSSKRVLLNRDDTSGDGAHGFLLFHAEWTADSRFFVAGTEASGGHQPWSHPIWVYSRAKNKVFNLTRLGIMTVGDYILKPPDAIEIKISPCENDAKASQPRRVTVTLHLLVSGNPSPVAPCPHR